MFTTRHVGEGVPSQAAAGGNSQKHDYTLLKSFPWFYQAEEVASAEHPGLQSAKHQNFSSCSHHT